MWLSLMIWSSENPQPLWPGAGAHLANSPWKATKACCLRTNGVNTNGAAARVINFDRLKEKGTPWHFWEDKSRLTGAPKKIPVKKHEIRSDPSSADPICPFPKALEAF